MCVTVCVYYLCYVTFTDERFLLAVRGGSEGDGEGVGVWKGEEGWERSTRNTMTYRQGSTHVLVGPQHWLLHLLRQVRVLIYLHYLVLD